MNNRENFVYRIMQLQKQNNLNDHELSRLLGYITPILNGKTFPQMENFIRICRALKITPEEFFRFDDDSPAETNALTIDIRKLDYMEKQHVHYIVNDIIKNRPK